MRRRLRRGALVAAGCALALPALAHPAFAHAEGPLPDPPCGPPPVCEVLQDLGIAPEPEPEPPAPDPAPAPRPDPDPPAPGPEPSTGGGEGAPPPAQAPQESSRPAADRDTLAVIPRHAPRATRKGTALVRLACAGRGVCTGLVRVELRRPRRAPVVLGTAPFEIGVGDRRSVRVALSPEARRRLARRGRLTVTIVALTRPGESTQRRSAARLTLRLASRGTR